MTDFDEDTLLGVHEITKKFGAVNALRGVTIQFAKGEIHAIVGENGAGKSTLMNILAGMHQPDSGLIEFEGKPVILNGPGVAVGLGIGIAFQELNLFQNLTVAEVIFGQSANGGLLLNRAKMVRLTKELIVDSGFEGFGIEPNSQVASLSIGLQQQVEILKSLSAVPRLLILDEPTSSLSGKQAQELFRTIKRLSKAGLSVVYISHHLHEVFEVADRVTVLKDGQVVASHLTKEVTEDVLIREMVGRTLERKFTGGKSSKYGGEYALEVRDLKKEPSVSDFSIKVRQGEIVGLAGLVGAGRTEALRLVAGLDRAESGSVKVAGKSLRIGNVTRAISRGLVYVTEDRRSDGLFLQKTIWENLRSRDIAGTFSSERVNLQQARERACSDIKHFGVVTASEEQFVSNLSGGNQQKVLLASRLNFKPAVLLIDEPTRGVDVGARAQIYGLLRSLADAGMAIVVASSDLLEIRSLCDRVLVMRAGKIVGELESDQLNEEQIMILATGTKERVDQL